MITSSQLQDLAKKAVSDDGFRAKAKKDPKAALESLGIKVPAGLAVKVYENGPSTIHAVLPESNGGSVAGLDKNVAKVFEKAWSDPKFKESLLKDPTGAIKAATNASLPKNLKIVIHADSKSEMNLVLPYVPAILALRGSTFASATNTSRRWLRFSMSNTSARMFR